MNVRMRTNYATRHGTCSAGGVIELPGDEARALLAADFAESIHEAAIVAPRETAARGKPIARGRSTTASKGK